MLGTSNNMVLTTIFGGLDLRSYTIIILSLTRHRGRGRRLRREGRSAVEEACRRENIFGCLSTTVRPLRPRETEGDATAPSNASGLHGRHVPAGNIQII